MYEETAPVVFLLFVDTRTFIPAPRSFGSLSVSPIAVDSAPSLGIEKAPSSSECRLRLPLYLLSRACGQQSGNILHACHCLDEIYPLNHCPRMSVVSPKFGFRFHFVIFCPYPSQVSGPCSASCASSSPASGRVCCSTTPPCTCCSS